MLNILLAEKYTSSSFEKSLNCCFEQVKIFKTTSIEQLLEYLSQKKENYDIVIISSELLDNDKFNVIEIIRKKTKYSDIPIIVIIENEHKIKLREIIQHETIDFITKPFKNLEIIARINNILKLAEYKRKLNQQQEETNELNKRLLVERGRIDRLLHNIFPKEIVEKLKQKGYVEAKIYQNATVMFIDFVNFTAETEKLPPSSLVNILDNYFASFDNLINETTLEKIKTVGDAYMCAGGILKEYKSHKIETLLFAIKIQYLLNSEILASKLNIPPWKAKVGIHCGKLIAGIIGKKKISYDVWGSAANIANRIEALCEPQKILVSEAIYNDTKEYFNFIPIGAKMIKGIGLMNLYYATSIKDEYAEPEKPYLPNNKLKEIIENLNNHN